MQSENNVDMISGKDKIIFMVEQELEKLRKRVKKYFVMQMATAAMFLLVIVCTMLSSKFMMFGRMQLSQSSSRSIGLTILFSVIICFILIIVIGSKAEKPLKEYRYYYKNAILEMVYNEQFGTVHFELGRGFTENEVRDKNVVKIGNEFHSEGFLQTEYQGIRLKRAEVSTSQKNQSQGGNAAEVKTYFDGKIYELDLDKVIFSGMQIRSWNNNYAVLPLFLSENQKVKIEDVRFNNHFEVYAANIQEVSDILSPSVKKQIMNWSSRYKNICINVIDDKIIVALDSEITSDYQIPIMQPVNLDEAKKPVVTDVIDIRTFIEEVRDIMVIP